MRTRAVAAVAAALVVAAVLAVLAVLLLTDGPEPGVAGQAQALAAELRCPSCDGESVAQSNAPMARSMRSEIGAQLRAGRSPAEVLDWFRGRYGDDVVLSPDRRGVGWVLWLVPPAAVAAGAVLVLRRRRPEPVQGPAPGTAPGTARRLGPATLGAVAVVVLAVGVAVPVLASGQGPQGSAAPSSTSAAAAPSAPSGDPVALGQQLDDAGRYADAVVAWRQARAAHPGSDAVRTRLAFDLLRTRRPAAVLPLVRPVARRAGDEQGFALLVLGLAQRDLGRPAADATLRAFLRVDPGHPAAGQVRRLLAHG